MLPRSTPKYPSRNESSPQSSRYEVTCTVCGAEESDARSVRKEERPELGDLIVHGKGLLVGLAHSVMKQVMRNAENRKQPILRVEFLRRRRDERNRPSGCIFLDFQG